MSELFSTYNIIIGVLVVVLVIFIYILRNLIVKVEKYEDSGELLQNILKAIQSTLEDSQKHLNELDKRGVFQSDDEVGYLFEQLKEVQNELNRFTNAQKEKQS